jgi:hypothetical protein
MGSLLLENPTMEKLYAQLYVHDPDEALDIRQHRNPQCNPLVMQNLQAMLYEVNPFISIYQQACHIMSSKPPEEHQNVALKLHLSEGADGRHYNLATTNEIAAIVPGNGEEEVSSDRDIILWLTGGSLRRISQLNPLYDPLHYVLLFSRGEEGWCTHMPLHPGPNGQTRSKNGNITQTCYYAYRLHVTVSFSNGLWMDGHPLSRASLTGFTIIRKFSDLISILAFVMLLQVEIMPVLMRLASIQFFPPLTLAVHVTCSSSFRIPWQSVAHFTSQISSSQ